jgi:hypothetical protein
MSDRQYRLVDRKKILKELIEWKFTDNFKYMLEISVSELPYDLVNGRLLWYRDKPTLKDWIHFVQETYKNPHYNFTIVKTPVCQK